MGEQIKPKKKYYSPFRRDDKNPSLVFYPSRDEPGRILFIDFGRREFSGDAVSFVKFYFNLSSRREAIERIYRDLKGGVTHFPKSNFYLVEEKSRKNYCRIEWNSRPFTENELKWWASYYLDIEDLKRENVYAIQDVYINGKKMELKGEFEFLYVYNEGVKLYCPFSENKELKWRSNLPISYMDTVSVNLNKKKEKWIITKSKKDKMVIRKFLNENCIAVQSENLVSLNESIVLDLAYKKNNIYLNFDNDETGIREAQKIKEVYPFMNLMFVKKPYKDVSDAIKDCIIPDSLIYLIEFYEQKDILQEYRM